jgi:hypothetical protein
LLKIKLNATLHMAPMALCEKNVVKYFPLMG